MPPNLRNEGTADRIVRVVLGGALLAYAIVAHAIVAHAWIGLLGIVPLVTGLAGFCPIYRLAGRSTSRT